MCVCVFVWCVCMCGVCVCVCVCACVVHLKWYQGTLSCNWSFEIPQTSALPFDVQYVCLLWVLRETSDPL